MRSTLRLVAVLAWCWGAAVAGAATVDGSVTIADRPGGRAVVYLESPAPPVTAPPQVVMDQKNLAFVPDLLAVRRGTVIDFTNSDDVQHNVFSPSEIAGKFNLGTYGPGASRTVTLNTAGDVVVLCNIHMEMEAHILVLEGPYFAIVAPNGSYRIDDVPAGTYTVKIWQERWLPFAQTVELPATGGRTVNIAVRQ